MCRDGKNNNSIDPGRQAVAIMCAMSIPLLIVVVIATFAMFIWSRKKLKTGMAQSQDKTFGSVAVRMGLRVDEGEPNTNLLYFFEQGGNYKRTLRATGQPYAHATTFWLTDSVERKEFFRYIRTTKSYGCFLEVKPQQPVAPFEVMLRNPHKYIIPPQDLGDRAELREIPSGNPAIDAQFIIRAVDTRVPAALVPALQILSQQLYVHLAGEGDLIWMNMNKTGLAYFSAAAEEYLLAMETAACSFEGKPLPARLMAPPPAPGQ